MLEVRHVSKTFNPGTITERKALKDISLTLNDGDFVTVIGGNGAGKSTLLNLIAGVHECDSGSIILDGEDITRQKEHIRAKYLGRVFQDPMRGTAATMEIQENLALALRRGKKRGLKWGVTSAEQEEFKKQLSLLELGLENRMTSKVGLLSGGQRQALTLLMATMVTPKLLLLDEHTAALDPKTSEQLMHATNDQVTRNHLTALMITHNLADALKYGNRLIILNAGKIVLDVRDEEKAALDETKILTYFMA